MRTVFPATFALLAFALPAQAVQDVVLRGEIEDAPGFGQFELDFTDVRLTSATIDLSNFVETKVEIEGTWNGSAVNPAIEVTSVSPAPELFEIGVRPRIGRESYLGFEGSPGDVVVGVISGGDAFIPFADGQVALIDPNLVVLTLFGGINGSGEAELEFGVPDNPSLVGLPVHAQGAIVSTSTFEVQVTNPYFYTIGS